MNKLDCIIDEVINTKEYFNLINSVPRFCFFFYLISKQHKNK
jgi:hypothetical protein